MSEHKAPPEITKCFMFYSYGFHVFPMSHHPTPYVICFLVTYVFLTL